MVDSGVWFLSGVARWLKEDDALAFYGARAGGQVRFCVSAEALARLTEYDLMYLDAPQAFDTFNRFEPQLQEIARNAYDLIPSDDLDISDAVRDAAAPRTSRKAGWKAAASPPVASLLLA